MHYIDSHIHIGDYNKVKSLLKTSPLRKKYRLYSSLNAEAMKFQETYISQCDYVFGIPIVLKEISTFDANKYLLEFSSFKKNVIPVYFVGSDTSFYEAQKSMILKEHFIHHDWKDVKNRFDSYEYLDQQDGYLLLHSLASIRVEYVQFLRMNFPNMNIIIAHMGRNGENHFSYMHNILTTFKDDEHIYFDTSTISDIAQLQYGINLIGCERILWGSDFPYDCRAYSPFYFYGNLYRLDLLSSELEKILYKNALRIALKRSS